MRDRARYEGALLLAARELRDVPVAQIPEAQRLESGIDDAPIVLRKALEKAETRKAPHRDDVVDVRRETPIDGLDLRHVGNRSGWKRARRGSEHFEDAAGRREQSRNCFQQRGLARSVRADDAERHSRLQGQIDAIECDDLIVANRQFANANRFAHVALPPSAFTIVAVS